MFSPQGSRYEQIAEEWNLAIGRESSFQYLGETGEEIGTGKGGRHACALTKNIGT